MTDCKTGRLDEVVDTIAQAPDAVHWRVPDTWDTGLTGAAAAGGTGRNPPCVAVVRQVLNGKDGGAVRNCG